MQNVHEKLKRRNTKRLSAFCLFLYRYILNFISSFIGDSTHSVSSYTGSFTGRSSGFYIHGVGAGALLVNSARLFFAYNHRSSKTLNEDKIINPIKPIKPPKQCNML